MVHVLPLRQPRRGRVPGRRALRRRRARPTSTWRSASASTSASARASRASRFACMFEELLERFPDIELAGPVRRLRSNFINGVQGNPRPLHAREAAPSRAEGTDERHRAHDYPKGWFVVAFSDEIAAGRRSSCGTSASRSSHSGARTARSTSSTPTARTWARTSARAARSSATRIQCPFHAWRYCGTGECVEIPYAKKIPPKARQRAWTRAGDERRRPRPPRFAAAPRRPSRSRSSPSTGATEWLPWATNMYHIKTHPGRSSRTSPTARTSPRVHTTEIDEFEFDVDGPHGDAAGRKGRRILPGGGVDEFASSTTYHGPGYLLMRMDGALQNYMLVAHTPVDEGARRSAHGGDAQDRRQPHQDRGLRRPLHGQPQGRVRGRHADLGEQALSRAAGALRRRRPDRASCGAGTGSSTFSRRRRRRMQTPRARED